MLQGEKHNATDVVEQLQPFQGLLICSWVILLVCWIATFTNHSTIMGETTNQVTTWFAKSSESRPATYASFTPVTSKCVSAIIFSWWGLQSRGLFFCLFFFIPACFVFILSPVHNIQVLCNAPSFIPPALFFPNYVPIRGSPTQAQRRVLKQLQLVVNICTAAI